MIVAILLSVLDPAALTPPQIQACRAHMDLFIEDAAREGGPVAGPTWFIRDWWDQQAAAAEAPGDDEGAIDLIKTDLALMRAEEPERFEAGRQDCVDTAIDAGAVPGMGPE